MTDRSVEVSFTIENLDQIKAAIEAVKANLEELQASLERVKDAFQAANVVLETDDSRFGPSETVDEG